MRSLSQFLSDYGESHQNPVNQWVHFICVPVIFFSTLGLLWLVPLGNWVGLTPDVGYWVNGATLLGVIAAVFYWRLGLGVLALMAGWFLVSLWGVIALEASALSLGWTSGILWVAAWAAQVWGHKVEGEKPSFVDDLVFLLVGPVFVSIEIGARLGLPVPHAMDNPKAQH